MKINRLPKVIIPLSGALLSALGFLSYHLIFSPSNLLESLPNPDLTNIDRQVAEKIQELRLQVEKNPTSGKSWGHLAMLLDIHDFKLEAMPCYQRAAKLDPDEFRWHYYGAILLNQLGAPETSNWFERSISLKPDYAPATLRYGQALYDAGHLEKSKDLFNQAITIDERSSHAHLGLGKIYLTKGDLSTSKNHLQKALEIAPRHREAHGVLAEVLRRLGLTEEAAKELQVAEKLPKITYLADPIYEELIAEGISPFWYGERARRLKRKGLINEAAREIEIALQLSPTPKGYNYLGNLLKEAKRFDDASIHYRKAIVLNPNYYEAMSNLAQLSLEMNQEEEAIFWAEKALKANPGSPELYTLLGDIYLNSGREAEAVSAFRNGLEFTRGSITLAKRLAWLLATSSHSELRDGTLAIKLAEAACEKTNYQNAEALDVLAAAYAENGRFDKAVKTAEKALHLALTDKHSNLANEIQSRLHLYFSKKAYQRSKSK